MFSVNSIVLIIEGTWPERATVENRLSTAFLDGKCALKRGEGRSRGTMNISTSCPLGAVKISENSSIGDTVAIPISCLFPSLLLGNDTQFIGW